MPRRDRETAQEEQDSTEQQEVGTPHNQAKNKAKAGTRPAKSTNEDSSVAVVASADETVGNNNNNNNPLKKVVFINHVLRFVKQDYVKSNSHRFGSRRNKKFIPIPRFIHLRHVSSAWKETVEFYNPQSRETALKFCRHFSRLVLFHGKKFSSPSVQGSIVLRDIIGWLSNVEITNIRSESNCDDDDDPFADSDSDVMWHDYGEDFSVCHILSFFSSCLDSPTWKEQKSGFEHHAAFVRDTLCWIAEFGVFKIDGSGGDWCDKHQEYGENWNYGDDVEVWCDIVDRVITMKEGEYFGFDTPEMRDVLLTVSKNITTSNGHDRYETVAKWFKIVFTLTRDNEKMQKIFGTKEVLDEFIRLSQHEELGLFDDSYDCYDLRKEIIKYYSSMFKSLAAITELKNNVNLFATVELRDTMVRIFKWFDIVVNGYCHGRESDSEHFLRLLHNIISANETNKKLFAVESVRDVMFRKCELREYFNEYSDMTDDIFHFRHRRWTANITNNEGACLFFENLVALFEVNPKLFLIDATRKNLVEFARRMVENDFCFKKEKEEEDEDEEEEEEQKEEGDCEKEDASPATIRSFLTALHTMLHHNEKLFFSERIDKFLIKVKTKKKLLQEESTKLFFSEIEEIYEKMKKPVKEQEREKNEQIIKMRKESRERQEQYWKENHDYLEIDSDEDLEVLAESEYWEEKGDFVNWNCYYREREEEKRTLYEEDVDSGNRESRKEEEKIAFFESHRDDEEEKRVDLLLEQIGDQFDEEDEEQRELDELLEEMGDEFDSNIT